MVPQGDLQDEPTDALISRSSGTFTVNSVVSNERFQIVGGLVNNNPVPIPRLNVTTTIQVNNTFLLRGNWAPFPATFSGTLLRGTGGQGLTIGGFSRLDAATIQTDVNVNEVATELWIANGLALEGTLSVTKHVVKIYAEGTQTWSSGTFVSSGATVAGALVTIGSVGTSTLTLGENVTFQAQVLFATGVGPAPPIGSPAIPHQLSLINRGTITALPATPALRHGVFTRTESFTNYGLVSGGDNATVSLTDKVWTNAATGRIKLSQGQFGAVGGMQLGNAATTTSWTNAGTIELINARAWSYEMAV